MAAALGSRILFTQRAILLVSLLSELFFLTRSVSAAEIPATLQGKSIIAHWQDTRTTKDVDSGVLHDFNMDYRVQAYFSTKGRVFTRYTETVPGHRNVAVDHNAISDQGAKLQWRFQGNELNVYIPLRSGMRRVDIQVEDGGRSCTLTVINARAVGAEHPIVIGIPSGVVRELLNVKITETDCSLKDGSVF